MKINLNSFFCMVLFLCSCSKLVDEKFDYTDGNAGFVAAEMAQSGKAVLQAAEVGRLGKVSEFEPDSFSIKFAYNPTTGQWIGNSSATFTNGTVSRVDTIKLMRSDGSPTPIPSISLVDSIWHKRVSTLSGNSQLANITIDVSSNATISKSGSDTIATVNGEGSTKFASLSLSTTTVKNLVYNRNSTVSGEWGYPESGTVNIERTFRSIEIIFSGGTTCSATVTKKTGDRASKTFTINLETGEEIE